MSLESSCTDPGSIPVLPPPSEVCLELDIWENPSECNCQGELGDVNKPAVITYHDVGMNHGTTFSGFLGDRSTSLLVSQFCWYHINAPGQEEDAENLPADQPFPTMTQLAEQIEYIAGHFQLSCFVGLGVGAGANVLARYAAISPERVQGLVLIDLRPNSLSWFNLSRIAGKVISWQLKGRTEGLSRLACYHLVRQAFGPTSEDVDDDLVGEYEHCIDSQNPHNLGLFLDSYYKRSSIISSFINDIGCSCLFIVSSNFDHKEEVGKLCSLMDTQKATFLEVANTSGLILADEPAKISSALRLFVQGLGLAPSLSAKTLPGHAGYGLGAREGEEGVTLEGVQIQLHSREH